MTISRREWLLLSAALLASPRPGAGAEQADARPRLGMYVHTHWAYNHPYSARTWTQRDWHGYLHGLRRLGYDAVMFWPLLDCMPADPTPSDRAFLDKIGKVIRLARDTFGMRFIVVSCPNTIGNDKAASYEYEKRPYFVCEHKVNPKDAADVRAFLAGRRKQFEPLAHADALAVIDSDPGGYIGSTDDEFVALLKGQIDAFRAFHPGAELDYWMLIGWENYNRFWAATHSRKPADPPAPLKIEPETFARTLSLLKEQVREPWGVLASMPQHLEASERLHLSDRRLYFPYGLIEGEPSFPMTNFDPAGIRAAVARYSARDYPRGMMANAQTHVLQLPHTYLFAHHFRHPGEAPDLERFAEQLLPGAGKPVVAGWEAVAKDADSQRAAAHALRNETRAGKPHRQSEYSGLLFNDPDRYLNDLADNLAIRADLADLRSATDACPALKQFLADFTPYQQRVGFADAFGGPLRSLLDPSLAKLHDPAIARILTQFDEWQNLPLRHGVVPRLLDSIRDYCNR